MLSGTTLYPPQNSGRGISPLANFFFITANWSIKIALEEIFDDCFEDQAPNWESLGLDEKYFKDSNFVIFSTLPIILTCLSRASQGNRRAS